MARSCRDPLYTEGASKVEDRPRTAYASSADATQAEPPRAIPRIGKNCIMPGGADGVSSSGTFARQVVSNWANGKLARIKLRPGFGELTSFRSEPGSRRRRAVGQTASAVEIIDIAEDFEKNFLNNVVGFTRIG